MTVTTFDELNQLAPKKSMPFEQYFGEMGLTDEQTKKRLDLAYDLEEEFIDILAWVFYTSQNREVTKEEVKERFRDAFFTSVDDELMKLGRTEDIIDFVSEEIAKTTVNRREEPFYLSEDRASLLAEDNANTLYNYSDFDTALSTNKTMKQWVTILDGRERATHNDADGQIQLITEPFEVGTYPMMYPKDDSLGAAPQEIINCRCTVRYF